jgi:hypothetical protein
MLDEILSQIEPAGNASWTSGKLLAVIGILAMSGMMFTVGLTVLVPELVKTGGMVLLGLGGFLLGIIAVVVLLYNFYKMLREIGVLG